MREPVDEMTGRRVAVCLVFTCFPARHAALEEKKSKSNSGGKKNAVRLAFFLGRNTIISAFYYLLL